MKGEEQSFSERESLVSKSLRFPLRFLQFLLN